MRVFLDTNVLVSAFTTRGLCEDVLREVLASHDLIVSVLLFNELERTLRGKFKIPKTLISEILIFLGEDTILSKVGDYPDVEILRGAENVSHLMRRSGLWSAGNRPSPFWGGVGYSTSNSSRFPPSPSCCAGAFGQLRLS